MTLKPIEDREAKRLLRDAIRIERWHKSRTAKRLKITRPTLDSWIRKFGLVKPEKNNK